MNSLSNFRTISGLCAVLLVLTALIGYQLGADPPPALAQGGEGQIYIVQQDDTLRKIAEKYLGHGDLYPQIVTATQTKHAQDATFAVINNPNLIFPGSKLWIPTPPAAPEPAPAASRQPTQAAAVPPAGSGPGGHIAFSFWNNAPERCTYEINIINVNACLAGDDTCQANRRIFSLNNASEPALSPDGQRLAFRGWGEIPEKYNEGQLDHPYFNCAEPRADRQLGHTTLDGTGYQQTTIFWEDSHPDWSPDGQRLLFDTGRNGDGITRIMAVSADGETEEELRIVGQQPSWAPDSDRFVYRGCDLTGNRCGLWVARALVAHHWDVGHNMVGPVLEEQAAAHPDWSPVGEQIVYQSPASGSWDLYVINSDGSGKRQLTSEAGIEGLPAWSPDGQWIAYLSDAHGNWGIWVIRADGSARHQLFKFDGGIFTPKAIFPYGGRDWLDEQISWSK